MARPRFDPRVLAASRMGGVGSCVSGIASPARSPPGWGGLSTASAGRCCALQGRLAAASARAAASAASRRTRG
eukprot:683582-Prymnesium_polylepis.2